MSRVKISEYKAKQLLFGVLGQEYTGMSIDFSQEQWRSDLQQLPDDQRFVAKVDQAVKKRNQLGLVTVNRSKAEIIGDLEGFQGQGYRYALVEPFVAHEKEEERYIAIQRTENGVVISYSSLGGVDIENNAHSLVSASFAEEAYSEAANTLELPNDLAKKLYDVFQDAHMTYLEINPCVIRGQEYTPLDAAVEVDSSAAFFVGEAWTEADVRTPKSSMHPAEKAVEELASKSPASLSLKVLNPDGALFLLLSGGGASVVVADEISNLGHHEDIANYGEYSGNPNEEETYLYATQVLALLLASRAGHKVLLIAGGVANFTDVAKTFKGIMRAIKDVQNELVAQNVAILIRRGGPNQQKGLADMKQFLDAAHISNNVHGPDVSLARAVAEAVERIAA